MVDSLSPTFCRRLAPDGRFRPPAPQAESSLRAEWGGRLAPDARFSNTTSPSDGKRASRARRPSQSARGPLSACGTGGRNRPSGPRRLQKLVSKLSHTTSLSDEQRRPARKVRRIPLQGCCRPAAGQVGTGRSVRHVCRKSDSACLPPAVSSSQNSHIARDVRQFLLKGPCSPAAGLVGTGPPARDVWRNSFPSCLTPPVRSVRWKTRVRCETSAPFRSQASVGLRRGRSEPAARCETSAESRTQPVYCRQSPRVKTRISPETSASSCSKTHAALPAAWPEPGVRRETSGETCFQAA